MDLRNVTGPDRGPGRGGSQEHHLPIFAAFSLTNAYQLALAVNIRDPQVDDFGNPQPGSIDGHQDRAMFEIRCALEECGYFSGTQDHRQLARLANQRRVLEAIVALVRDPEEDRRADTV